MKFNPATKSAATSPLVWEIGKRVWPELVAYHPPAAKAAKRGQTNVVAYSSDCCIAACRVTEYLLCRFGYQCEIVPTTVSIANAILANKIITELRQPADEAEALRWREEGCYSVIIGHYQMEQRPNKVPVHLVVKVSDGEQAALVDTSIKQADRPEFDIVLPNAIVVPWGSHPDDRCITSFLATEEVSNKEMHITYIHHPKPDLRYKTSPDWVTDRWKPFAERILSSLPKHLQL